MMDVVMNFIELMEDCQYYKEAMQIVEKKEALGQVSPDILRLTVCIVFCSCDYVVYDWS